MTKNINLRLCFYIIIIGFICAIAGSFTLRETKAYTTCNFQCDYRVQDGDFTYDVHMDLNGAGSDPYICSYFSGCDAAEQNFLTAVSVANPHFTYFSECTNGHGYATADLQVRNVRGGGAGCPSAQYYCDVTKTCIPVLTVCNPAVADYVPDKINPNIPAQLGPVRLKTLNVTPPIGNPGYQCKIAWNNAFASYDNATLCTFTGPNNTSLSFNPASTTAPTSFTSNNITTDTIFKMTCAEEDTGTTQSIESVCRLNWNYKEVN